MAEACWERPRPRWYQSEKLDSTQSPEMEDQSSLKKYYQPLRLEAISSTWWAKRSFEQDSGVFGYG
jgi:hypothetical protein